jgi:hypothetical protein
MTKVETKQRKEDVEDIAEAEEFKIHGDKND